jgi:transcriptional regulator with XRE-family HTH domain
MSGVRVKGEKIEQLRLEKLVMERKEFAALVGISITSVWYMERGPQSTRPRTLRKVADALGVTPQSLVRKQSERK